MLFRSVVRTVIISSILGAYISLWTIATIYSALYQPQMWKEYGNSLIPQAISSVLGNSTLPTTRYALHRLLSYCTSSKTEHAPRRDRLSRRDPTFTNNSYTEPAVVCADSVNADPNVTMDVIFAEVLNDTRAISHTCTFSLHSALCLC